MIETMASLKVNDRMHIWAEAAPGIPFVARAGKQVEGCGLRLLWENLTKKDPTMLDKNFVRENLDFVREKLAARGGQYPLDELVAADTEWKGIIIRSEELRRQRNEATEEIGKMKRAGHDTAAQQARVKEISGEIKSLEEGARLVEERLNALLHSIPNLPNDSVPVGPDETANLEVRRWGTAPSLDFTPLDHVDLGSSLGILDMERAAKIAGARFALLCGAGALMERALINFMLDVHTKYHGYREVMPPLMANATSLFGTGNLPKFAEDLFKVEDTNYYLIPTAEVPVTNMYRDEILDGDKLPIHHVAYTSCFRREKMSAGRDVRGIKRGHQFDKVEMVKLVRPETSMDELATLIDNAEDVCRGLGIPHRIIQMCTGDLSFTAAVKYDVEIWAPGCQEWLEVSSCTNFMDFQARRANLRYRPAPGAKPDYVHTLNGSGLALPRVMIAVLETYQQSDGSITMPEVLRPYMGGLERIG